MSKNTKAMDDSKLLDWMISRGAHVSWSNDHEVCNVWLPAERDGTEERPAEGYPQKCYYDAREAIVAAINDEAGRLARVYTGAVK